VSAELYVRKVAGSIVFPSAMARSRKRRSIGHGDLAGCRPVLTGRFIFCCPQRWTRRCCDRFFVGRERRWEVDDGKVRNGEVACECCSLVKLNARDSVRDGVHISRDVEDTGVNLRFYTLGDGVFDNVVEFWAAA
jgi:hypothetical protein